MRLFIAIKVPEELHRYLTQLQSQFPDLRETHVFHLTVQFLGNEIEDPDTIIEALRKIKFDPFDIQMGDAVPFPNAFRPRGVWIECEESETLMNLADQIRSAMDEINLMADKPFKAHVTLGRYKRPPYGKLKPVTGEPHTFTINKFYLIESTLAPEGPKYKTLAEF